MVDKDAILLKLLRRKFTLHQNSSPLIDLEKSRDQNQPIETRLTFKAKISFSENPVRCQDLQELLQEPVGGGSEHVGR